MRPTSKKIESTDDVEGFASLSDEDKAVIASLIPGEGAPSTGKGAKKSAAAKGPASNAGRATGARATSNALEGCTIAVWGTPISGTLQDVKNLISDNGGEYSTGLNTKLTHVVAFRGTPDQRGLVARVVAAGVSLVTDAWLNASLAAGTAASETKFRVDVDDLAVTSPGSTATAAAAPMPAAAPAKRATTKRKRDESETEDDDGTEEDEELAAPGPPAKKAKTAPKKEAPDPTRAVAGALLNRAGRIPVDGQCVLLAPIAAHLGLGTLSVVDDYSAVLLMASDVRNYEKFYIIQMLRGSTQPPGQYIIWTRYGKGVENGGSCKRDDYPSKAEAAARFEKLFKEKTGNAWEHRGDFVRKFNKYVPRELWRVDED